MISQDSSSPLFVVIGSTGVQGRSVIKAIEESTQPYRVRAITRDTNSAAARALKDIGCTTYKADVDDVESLKGAFEGAKYAFLMTNSDYTDKTPEFEHEYSQGKNQFDAAVQADVQIIAWAGEPSMKKIYNGRGKVDNFEVKARVTAYGRSLTLPSGKPPKILDIQPGAYLTNVLVTSPPRPSPDDPNTFVLSLAVTPDTDVPMIDMQEDYGKYVVGPIEWALEGPEERWVEVKTVHAAPEYITGTEMAKAFEKVSGKNVKFQTLPDESLHAFMSQVAGERAADCLVEMYKGIREVGYCGGVALETSNAHLPRPTRTFQQALEARMDLVHKVFDSAE